MRRKLFICSPFGGKQENVERAKELCRKAIDKGWAPFAPHLIYPQILDESKPDDRIRGIECGLEYLKGCYALLLADGPVSPGMQIELSVAEQYNVKIIKEDKL